MNTMQFSQGSIPLNRAGRRCSAAAGAAAPPCPVRALQTLARLLILVSLLAPACARAGDWVVYEGKEGPGRGKHIVFLTGDEEYRSEEGLPQLARILAVRHGFKCTVLFAINPPGWSKREIAEFKRSHKDAPEPKPDDPDTNDGTIDPNEPTNIPGMQALDSADLVVMLWRFRRPDDASMKHFTDYYLAGKPFIALRTSTHAFQGLPAGPYAKFNWQNNEWKGGFGRQ